MPPGASRSWCRSASIRGTAARRRRRLPADTTPRPPRHRLRRRPAPPRSARCVTLSDNGWVQPFTGTIQVETDATVVYAVVFNGAGGNAPIEWRLGGREGIHEDQERRSEHAECLARRVPPGELRRSVRRPIAVTHSTLGYDPVRVSVFTVRGANITTPNGTVTEVDITPVTGNRDADGVDPVEPRRAHDLGGGRLRGCTSNGTGITATPGFQTTRRAGRIPMDCGACWAARRVRSASRHSYDLKADAAGRSAYLVSFTVNGASGAPPPPPPPPATAGDAGRERRVHDDPRLRHGADSAALNPDNVQGWTSHERPWEQMLYTQPDAGDATRPSRERGARARRGSDVPQLRCREAMRRSTSSGTDPGPATPGRSTSRSRSSCRRTGTTMAAEVTNDGTKLFFFGMQPQNNHFIGIASRQYDGSDGQWLAGRSAGVRGAAEPDDRVQDQREPDAQRVAHDPDAGGREHAGCAPTAGSGCGSTECRRCSTPACTISRSTWNGPT